MADTPWYKRIHIPHVFVLLTAVIFIGALCTYVLPSGEYRRETKTIEGRERTLVVPGTFQAIPKHYSLRGVLLGDSEKAPEAYAEPVSIQGFLTAIPRGLEQSADIIFFIFMIGGTFGILQRSGTIPAMIRMLLDRFGHSAKLLDHHHHVGNCRGRVDPRHGRGVHPTGAGLSPHFPAPRVRSDLRSGSGDAGGGHGIRLGHDQSVHHQHRPRHRRVAPQ